MQPALQAGIMRGIGWCCLGNCCAFCRTAEAFSVQHTLQLIAAICSQCHWRIIRLYIQRSTFRAVLFTGWWPLADTCFALLLWQRWTTSASLSQLRHSSRSVLRTGTENARDVHAKQRHCPPPPPPLSTHITTHRASSRVYSTSTSCMKQVSEAGSLHAGESA